MRKTILLSMLLLAGTVSMNAVAGNKKDKKQKKDKAPTEAACCQKPVTLMTTSDTVSYAGGYAATDGLMPYLQEQLHVDTAYMADFVRGYREAVKKAEDPAFMAYVAGTSIAAQTKDRIMPNMNNAFAGTPDTLNAEHFHAGFLAGLKQDTTYYNSTSAREFFQNRVRTVEEAKNKAYREENEAWLKDNATKPGVVTTPSGLQYKVLTQGTGAKPQATDEVEVVYEGKTIDGNIFDATSRHGGKGSDKFRCNQVIKGWTEALTSMPVGSKWEIYIPQELAYGARQAGQIKPYSTLIFTVELKGITPQQTEEKAEAGKAGAATKTTKKSPVRKVRRK